MKTATVLIVDDDEDIRDVLRLTFELDHFSVVEAANGLEAITAVRRDEPDFVILDFNMPGQDGEKTAKVLRCIAPEATIVAFSGILTFKPEWADAFLSKNEVGLLTPLITSLASRGPVSASST